MAKIIGYEKIVQEIKSKLIEGKDLLLYAFNATGKTRISYSFVNNIGTEVKINTLCYNSILEDWLSWDESNRLIRVNDDCWFFEFINKEGLDIEIASEFLKLVDIKVQPKLNYKERTFQFNLATGDDEAATSIKISKGEETLFKWSVFYTVLKHALEILNDKPEDRSDNIFDNLSFVVIDDPVSSLDDYRLYTLSMQLLELIIYSHEKQLGVHFLILTHHTLFFNTILNTLKNRKKKDKFLTYYLSKINDDVILEKIEKEPLTYHVAMLLEIEKCINSNTLEKRHFNMFRSILEKTCIFLGYDCWQDLFKDFKDKAKIEKLINMNSHERYSEMETRYLTKEQTDCFIEGFEYFKNTYKFYLK